MSGCFGSSIYDRWLERQVDRHTDPPGEPDPDKLADWIASEREKLAEDHRKHRLHQFPCRHCDADLADELRVFDEQAANGTKAEEYRQMIADARRRQP